MLVHVGLLDAKLGPYSCHVELMLSQERRVPFEPLPGPKGTRRFWIMSGPCWAYMDLRVCCSWRTPILKVFRAGSLMLSAVMLTCLLQQKNSSFEGVLRRKFAAIGYGPPSVRFLASETNRWRKIYCSRGWRYVSHQQSFRMSASNLSVQLGLRQNWRISMLKVLHAICCAQGFSLWELAFVPPFSGTLHTLHFTLDTPHFTVRTTPYTLYTPHSTLYTLHSTLYTLHFALYTLHFTPRSLRYTLYTLHSTLYTWHSTLCTWHSTVCTLHCTLHTLHFTLRTLHFTPHTLHFTLHTPHSTLYISHLTLYTLHSTHLYTLHFTHHNPDFTFYTLHSPLNTSPSSHSTLCTPSQSISFHTSQSTLVQEQGNNLKDCWNMLFHKSVLRDCIRVRWLVLFFPGSRMTAMLRTNLFFDAHTLQISTGCLCELVVFDLNNNFRLATSTLSTRPLSSQNIHHPRNMFSQSFYPSAHLFACICQVCMQHRYNTRHQAIKFHELLGFGILGNMRYQGQDAIFGAVYARKGRTKKLQRHGLHRFALDQPSINGIGPIN